MTGHSVVCHELTLLWLQFLQHIQYILPQKADFGQDILETLDLDLTWGPYLNRNQLKTVKKKEFTIDDDEAGVGREREREREEREMRERD